MNERIRETLCEMGFEDSVVFDSPDYDDAIVGVTDEGQVVYDYDKMVRSMMQRDGISQEEAIDFIEYNTLRALQYIDLPDAREKPPIIMYPIITDD